MSCTVLDSRTVKREQVLRRTKPAGPLGILTFLEFSNSDQNHETCGIIYRLGSKSVQQCEFGNAPRASHMSLGCNLDVGRIARYPQQPGCFVWRMADAAVKIVSFCFFVFSTTMFSTYSLKVWWILLYVGTSITSLICEQQPTTSVGTAFDASLRE